jgi:hypothetical protein
MDSGRGAVSAKHRLAHFSRSSSGDFSNAGKKSNDGGRTAAQKTKKRISFMKPSDNKIKIVVPPTPEEKGKYWFQELQTEVVKPVVFTIEATDKINIEVETGLMISALLAQLSKKKKKQPAPTNQNETMMKVTSLLVKRVTGSSVILGTSLRAQMEEAAGMRRPREQMQQWFTVASTASVGEAVKLGVFLPPGAYHVQSTGPLDLTVFAQAEDVALKLA